MNEIRIVIAEDHETVREGIKMLIEAEEDMKIIGEAGDGREAIKLTQELAPDVLLMDVSMPELNGLVATAKLKRVMPDIKILTLTRHTDTAYLQRTAASRSFRLCFKTKRVRRAFAGDSRRRRGRKLSRSGDHRKSFQQFQPQKSNFARRNDRRAADRARNGNSAPNRLGLQQQRNRRTIRHFR